MSKSLIFALTLASFSAIAEVTQIELSKCYVASAPKLVKARRGSSEYNNTFYWYDLSYSYTVQTKVLVIVSDNYGNVVNQSTVIKSMPERITFSDQSNRYAPGEFDQEALEFFEREYDQLMMNKCEDQ